MNQDSGLELIKSIPDWTRSSKYKGKNKYKTTLKVDKKSLRVMWDIMTTTTDFNISLNAPEIILSYLNRVNPIDWLPETIAPNIVATPDIEDKLLAYIMYRWVKGDFTTKHEAMVCVMENGNSLNNYLTTENDNLTYKLGDFAVQAMNGMQEWFNTPLDELNAYKIDVDLKKRKFTQHKMLERERIKEVIDDLYATVMIDEIYVNTLEFTNKIKTDYKRPANVVDDLMAEVEDMSIKFSGIETNTAIDMVIDFSNEKIDEVLAEAEAKLKSAKPYSTGMQGLDTMLQGGPRAGEYLSIGALSHNYKSGLTTTLACGLATANDWTVGFPKEESKPAMVFVSLEDNLENFYRNAFEVLWASGYTRFMEVCRPALEVSDGRPVKEKMQELPFKAIVTDVTRTIESRGLRLITIKADPTQWSLQGMIGLANSLLLDDVNIKILVTDYLDKLPDSNMGDNGVIGEAKRMKVRIARNWGLKRGIPWINPWQLNSEVARYLTSGADMLEFMKYIAASPAYQGCRTLSTDLDIELMTKTFTDTDILSGCKLLGISRGKHRGFGDVEEKDKVIFYAFHNGLKPGLDGLGGTKKMHVNTITEFNTQATTSTDDNSVDF